MNILKWQIKVTLGLAAMLLPVGALTAHPENGQGTGESATAQASGDGNTLEQALRGGKPSLAVRLRYEDVQQDNALDDAGAFTTRARLGYETASWHGLSGLLEFEVNEAWGGEAYNSGPPPNGNRKTRFSVIPDPEGEEVNQWYLQYAGWLPETRFRLGRQRLILDNARFVGNVGWRQNEQTYDAFSISSQALPHLDLTYAFLNQVNDIFFRDIEMDSHLVNVGISVPDRPHRLVAYGYFLDFETPGRTDQKTLGLRASGNFDLSPVKLGYTLEYASQQDHADAPSTVDADYSLIELSAANGPLSAWMGRELLGGDGVYAFSTPLATLHAFNGFADQFLATPLAGLEDRYVGAGYKLPIGNGVVVKAIYHDFTSDSAGIDHGEEIDAIVAYKPAPGWSLLAKYADYSADMTSVDTRKLWLQIEYSY